MGEKATVESIERRLNARVSGRLQPWVICDAEGVPELIQRLIYNWGSMEFEALFFNGEGSRFTTDLVCPSMGLMQRKPRKLQWRQAEDNIIKIALKEWTNCFNK